MEPTRSKMIIYFYTFQMGQRFLNDRSDANRVVYEEAIEVFEKMERNEEITGVAERFENTLRETDPAYPEFLELIENKNSGIHKEGI